MNSFWKRSIGFLFFILVLCFSSLGNSQTITEFSAGITPGFYPTHITSGPDGNLWFTENGFRLAGRVGRITPTGVITEFTEGITPGNALLGITSGSDGNLWFIDTGDGGDFIGRITPTGVVTEFPIAHLETRTPGGLPIFLVPHGITKGPDGNLWATGLGGWIIRMTLTGITTEFPVGTVEGNTPFEITSGPDGNLWFTEGLMKIGRITPTGTLTEFTPTFAENGIFGEITSGPDGNLWVIRNRTLGARIGKITPAGILTEFDVHPSTHALGITSGPDGNIWFTDQRDGGPYIGRITPTGTVTEFSSGITADANLGQITSGPAPARELWFTEAFTTGTRDNPTYRGQIGRVTLPAISTSSTPPLKQIIYIRPNEFPENDNPPDPKTDATKLQNLASPPVQKEPSLWEKVKEIFK